MLGQLIYGTILTSTVAFSNIPIVGGASIGTHNAIYASFNTIVNRREIVEMTESALLEPAKKSNNFFERAYGHYMDGMSENVDEILEEVKNESENRKKRREYDIGENASRTKITDNSPFDKSDVLEVDDEYNRRVSGAWEEWNEEIEEEQEEHFERIQEINDAYAAKREEIILKYDGDEENADCQEELSTAEQEFQEQISEEDARFTKEFEEETMERDYKIHKAAEEDYDEEKIENYFNSLSW